MGKEDKTTSFVAMIVPSTGSMGELSFRSLGGRAREFRRELRIACKHIGITPENVGDGVKVAIAIKKIKP